jgi:hypothetical protein
MPTADVAVSLKESNRDWEMLSAGYDRNEMADLAKSHIERKAAIREAIAAGVTEIPD